MHLTKATERDSVNLLATSTDLKKKDLEVREVANDGNEVGSRKATGKVKHNYLKTIISYNIEEKVDGEVLGPVGMNKGHEVIIGMLKGQPCFYCKDYDTGIQVWVVKDYGIRDSWSKFISLEVPSSSYRIPSYNLKSMPLCFVKNDEVLLKLQSNLALFDLKQSTARNLEIRNNLK
ncbi:hypothetical protein IFM89_030774 [Coptis chinensis]|uniref:F-box associated domain-containing protein n=1 Tax=Coptis chinensis TaxID=261450 RepID=A0A835IEQ2_9MAGN|nr:hypothetical protein IFM89_030774 [Coptis chinensis]